MPDGRGCSRNRVIENAIRRDASLRLQTELMMINKGVISVASTSFRFPLTRALCFDTGSKRVVYFPSVKQQAEPHDLDLSKLDASGST
jgi:hypothetical protein